jgi:hypothetical protein
MNTLQSAMIKHDRGHTDYVFTDAKERENTQTDIQLRGL